MYKSISSGFLRNVFVVFYSLCQEVIFMSAKLYGYAENNKDVETLQAYAGIDIILEDMEAHGQYQILRRFLRKEDTLMVVHLSALGG